MTAPRGASESQDRAGAYYDERRQFLVVEGVVARSIPTFPLAPRPKRGSLAATFDHLGGNTTLGIHLAEVPAGGEKRGHRHLDEATFYIVSGRGWTELRQSDERAVERVDWAAGDLIVIPSNAWHQHFNAESDRPARQIAFKNTRLLRKLFHSREFVYQNAFRFQDRYDDEPDYWRRRETADDGRVRTNVVRGLVGEELEPDPTAGEGVALRRYAMGGHRTIEHAVVEIAPGGHVRAHRHVAEEALYILAGAGRTHLWSEDGREVTIRWTAGDLVVPPFNLWRQHVQEGPGPARYLWIRNGFIERALGIRHRPFDSRLPERFPSVLEADRAAVERAALERAASDSTAAATPVER